MSDKRFESRIFVKRWRPPRFYGQSRLTSAPAPHIYLFLARDFILDVWKLFAVVWKLYSICMNERVCAWVSSHSNTLDTCMYLNPYTIQEFKKMETCMRMSVFKSFRTPCGIIYIIGVVSRTRSYNIIQYTKIYIYFPISRYKKKCLLSVVCIFSGTFMNGKQIYYRVGFYVMPHPPIHMFIHIYI